MKWQVASGKWQAKIGSPRGRALAILAFALGLAAGPATMGFAQETPRPKDDALDSLLEKLADPSDGAGQREGKSPPAKKEAGASKKTGADSARTRDPGAKEKAGSPQPSGDQPKGKKAGESAPLSGKDQEVDELLQKLGETTETPAPDDRRRGGGGERPDDRGPSPKPGKSERDRLSGKDKETDEHLEELTGRKRRKKDDNEERTGPAGELIKEMRDLEQKLAKPDTGEATREEQKKVVKRIETLIEEARQSGQSSIRRIVMRRSRQQGKERGQQPGQTEGAMAQGAPATRPKPPPSKHSTAGGRDIWGHLPPEMRALIENMINEEPLEAKQELINRYFLAVGKGKPVREESP